MCGEEMMLTLIKELTFLLVKNSGWKRWIKVTLSSSRHILCCSWFDAFSCAKVSRSCYQGRVPGTHPRTLGQAWRGHKRVPPGHSPAQRFSVVSFLGFRSCFCFLVSLSLVSPFLSFDTSKKHKDGGRLRCLREQRRVAILARDLFICTGKFSIAVTRIWVGLIADIC